MQKPRLGSSTFTKLKSRFKSNVIYKLTCKDCDVFQNISILKKRIIQDKTKLKKRKSTELWRHSINHSIDFENIKILNSENNTYIRFFIENYCIEIYNNSVNIRNTNINISYINQIL